jgi:hypothetical protein
MQYRIGDQVIFLNHTGSGRVCKVDGDIVYVVDQDGFEVPFPPSELILKSETRDIDIQMDSERIDAILQAELDRIRNAAYKAIKTEVKSDTDDVLEVDLHIHELVEANGHLSNFQMVQIQMAHFNRMMEHAFEHRVPRIVFIHGVGKGVLRQELRDAIGFYPNCTFRDADFRRYGQGATEVLIRFN